MELETLQADLQIKYSAVFIPFSQSRSFKPGAKERDWNLNWIVMMTRDSKPQAYIRTDYSQGVAHIPNYISPPRVVAFQNDYRALCWEAVEKGLSSFPKQWSLYRTHAPARRIPPPDFNGVLHCLLMDGEAANCGNFEDWADELGYDTDSRKAEETYRACVAIGREMNKLFDASERQTLQQLFQDY